MAHFPHTTINTPPIGTAIGWRGDIHRVILASLIHPLESGIESGQPLPGRTGSLPTCRRVERSPSNSTPKLPFPPIASDPGSHYRTTTSQGSRALPTASSSPSPTIFSSWSPVRTSTHSSPELGKHPIENRHPRGFHTKTFTTGCPLDLRSTP